MAARDLLAGLNPAQRDAAVSLRGPLLILAGAGTGKTRVITVRIANLVRHGVTPSRILAVTFTNKAAREMRERTLALLGRKLEHPPLVSTFHSLGVNILRQDGNRLGYRPNFAIYDRGDQETVARGVLRELKLDASALSPGDLLAYISHCKTKGLAPQTAFEAAVSERERISAQGYARYQAAVFANGALDFDDLLARTEELFLKFPDILRKHQQRWDHVLVDEYQDTNAGQFRLLELLCKPHKNICVVGDDDQSIYAWRGADVRNILDFEEQFAGAKIVKLEQNYRSMAPILAVANAVIEKRAD
ncbi:MAG TPA: UvrD-helicase domain-containing protein, partial [Planctomycetia bacterium]|nr:UvrD-helicase domain-containing protein [Planctomycetia bacterium]